MVLCVLGRGGGSKGDYPSADSEGRRRGGSRERRERRGEEVRGEVRGSRECLEEERREDRRGKQDERKRSKEETRGSSEKALERTKGGRESSDRRVWSGSRGDLDKSSLELERGGRESSERERRRGEQERGRNSRDGTAKTVRVEEGLLRRQEVSSRNHVGEGRTERRTREEDDGRSHRREEKGIMKSGRREEGSVRHSRSEEGLLSTAEVIIERDAEVSHHRRGIARGEETRSSKRRSTESEFGRDHRSQSVDRPERREPRRVETGSRGEERRRQTFTRSKSHDDFSEQSQKEGGPWRRSTRRDSRDSRRDSRGESREGSSTESEPFYLHSPRQASVNGYERIQSLFYEESSMEGRKKSREDPRIDNDGTRQPRVHRRRAAPSMPLPSIDYGGLSVVGDFFSSSCCCPFSIKHNSY